jgi:hypothetical protein
MFMAAARFINQCPKTMARLHDHGVLAATHGDPDPGFFFSQPRFPKSRRKPEILLPREKQRYRSKKIGYI